MLISINDRSKSYWWLIGPFDERVRRAISVTSQNDDMVAERQQAKARDASHAMFGVVALISTVTLWPLLVPSEYDYVLPIVGIALVASIFYDGIAANVRRQRSHRHFAELVSTGRLLNLVGAELDPRINPLVAIAGSQEDVDYYSKIRDWFETDGIKQRIDEYLLDKDVVSLAAIARRTKFPNVAATATATLLQRAKVVVAELEPWFELSRQDEADAQALKAQQQQAANAELAAREEAEITELKAITGDD